MTRTGLWLAVAMVVGCAQPAPEAPQPAAPQPAAPPAPEAPQAAPVGCNLAGTWTLQLTAKAPARPKATICDDNPFTRLTLDMGPYSANPDAGVLFGSDSIAPTLFGPSSGGGPHDPELRGGWFDAREVGATCSGRLRVEGAQGHSWYSASYQLRVEAGRVEGEGTWTWARDLGDHDSTCPEGDICDCEIEMKVTGSIAVPP